jgi:hypothetical protein
VRADERLRLAAADADGNVDRGQPAEEVVIEDRPAARIALHGDGEPDAQHVGEVGVVLDLELLDGGDDLGRRRLIRDLQRVRDRRH